MKIYLLFLSLILVGSISCNRTEITSKKKASLSSLDSTKSFTKSDSLSQIIDERNSKLNIQLRNLINNKWAKYQPDTIKKINTISYFRHYAFQKEISDTKYLAFSGRIIDITMKGTDTVLLLLSVSRQDAYFQIKISRENFNKIISIDQYSPLSRRIFVLVSNIQIKGDLSEVEGEYQYNTIVDCNCIDIVSEE